MSIVALSRFLQYRKSFLGIALPKSIKGFLDTRPQSPPLHAWGAFRRKLVSWGGLKRSEFPLFDFSNAALIDAKVAGDVVIAVSARVHP